EQRAGRRDQQCRYCCYGKKFGYSRHEVTSSSVSPAATPSNATRTTKFLRSFTLEGRILPHRDEVQ
ncbi:hypothetical protein, partial [Bradyrhizobium hipponense]|uniref:hypothetical protein n=1 Tax=Bradyrhizobium hipponense TaxID=2605638 RepID=UPI001AED8A7D